ncbi:MAG: hypothetical protein RMY36_019280 [Nostoc sp. SerVER01]|nr:hypothetical protein [Nostoc sp. SerVER01]
MYVKAKISINTYLTAYPATKVAILIDLVVLKEVESDRTKLELTHTLRILGVLAVAYGKPQSVYDKLSFLAIFA